MGFFSRISDIFSANVNDLLDKAEDPEKMIKLMVLEMQEAVTKSTSALAQAMGNEKRLEMQFNKLTASSGDMQSKAVIALKAGNEDLAKQALTKKATIDTQLAQYKTMYEQASSVTTTMKSQVDKLKMKLDEARMKEQTLIARHKSAKAQTEFSKQIGGFDDNSFAKFDKFEEKVIKQEAEAQAFNQLADGQTNLDDQFAQLEQKSQVDDELAKLKASLNQG
ncbi:MAG: PspA/IM30 family protein [Verrucomicrobia bacterium]|nr:PspA/IM30 family protein [Cytophagales bacterium]